MKVVQSRYLHFIDDQMRLPVQLTNENAPFSLYIVYFINCMIHPNYIDWLYHQVKLVESYTDHIYIVATIKQEEKDKFTEYCLRIFPKAIVSCTFTNEYEYPGILKVWELAQLHRNPNDIFLYFHSKGMTHHSSYKGNRNDSYNVILGDIHKIYDIYTTFPTIDKIGYTSGGNGWIWYNFWYARGSYLSGVERPLLTTRRHYYEDWLGRKVISEKDLITDVERPHSYYPNTLSSCYGFSTDRSTYGNIGSYYCPNTNKMFRI